MKKFDLNIEKVLENWESYHAIREVIANALDEQILSQTQDIRISQDDAGYWHIRDFGRGLHYEHLTQNENDEKLTNPQLIGKFGVGLKDALATFDRRGIGVLIKSKFGDITLGKSEKHNFEDIVTLHAYVSDASEPNMTGTDIVLQNCAKSDINNAKALFLKFSKELTLEKTQFGDVIHKKSDLSRIYINGILVAEEEHFLFSYNITSLNAAIKKALNRERTNVGRTAYSDRVKSILLQCKSEDVSQRLASDLKLFKSGLMHDELKWADIAAYAAKFLNSNEKIIYVTPSEIIQNPDFIDEAQRTGREIITIPDNVKYKISGQEDFSGTPMQDLTKFKSDWDEGFEFKFVPISQLSSYEKEIYGYIPKIISLIGYLPSDVKHIKISETMRMEAFDFVDATGLWNSASSSIIIKRTQLRSLKDFAGTLLHEIAHARSGAPDVSREFEFSLTELLGVVVETGIEDAHSKRGFFSRLFRL